MVDEAALGVQGPDPQGDDSGDENSQPSQVAFTFTCKCGICGDASSANSSSASCMVASGGGGGGGDPGKNTFVVNSNGSPLALTLNFTQCDIGSIVLPRVPRTCPGCIVLPITVMGHDLGSPLCMMSVHFDFGSCACVLFEVILSLICLGLY